jgi:uncharacterized RDD family membrane protein YckC
MMDIQYKIIGGDGEEYGPATLDELKEWILDGRVAGMTRVWRSDLAAWSAADRYSELRPDLARLHASVTTQHARPCGFWARLAAYILDRFVLCALFIAIWTPIAGPRHWTIPVIPDDRTPENVQHFRDEASVWMDHAAPIFYPILLVYEVLLTGRFGATLGKMAIGARITMVDGAPIGYGRALLRSLAARLSEFCFFFGYFVILTNPEKRALHDWLAGTKVIYNR